MNRFSNTSGTDSSPDNLCPELPLVPEYDGKNEMFLCACGWFWGPQPRFLSIRGVVRCIVGYTGGQTLHPTYSNIQDHTEALLVEFNPTVVSYEDLVIEWTRMHSPYGKAKCQYRSAVWYMNEDQKEICTTIVDGLQATHGKGCSSVEKATRFYRGEEYHQNFHANMRSGGGRY